MREFLIFDELGDFVGKAYLVAPFPIGLVLAVFLLFLVVLLAPIYLSYIIFIKRGWSKTDNATKLLWVILLPVMATYPYILVVIGEQIALHSAGEILGVFIVGICNLLICSISVGFWMLVYKVIKRNF